MSISKIDKSLYFEYFLSKAIEHSKQYDFENNDFSILKSQKLLFLLTVANIDNGGSQYLINNVFDNFVAMPYGPVEIDLYNETKSNSLNFFSITSSKLIMKCNSISFSNLDTYILNEIDKSIQLLIEKNPLIFILKANVLVEITHLFQSWRLKYEEARLNGSFKENMPKNLIINDNKYYRLNQFELI